MISEHNVRIYVTISREVHKKLLRESEMDDTTVSKLVNSILKKHYEQNEQKEKPTE